MQNQSIVRSITVIIFAIILHLDLSPDLKLIGVAAEVPLAISVAAALTGGVKRGAIFGFCCGLTLDMFSLGPVGLHALIYGFIGWVFGHIYSEEFGNRVLFSTLMISAGTATGLSLFALLADILGEIATRDITYLRIIAVASAINGLLARPLIKIGHWMWALDPLARRQAAI